MLTMKPSSATLQVKPFDVYIDGELIGKVAPYGGDDDKKLRWHAAVHWGRSRYGTHLLQGFGETPRKALANAIEREREDAQALMSAADSLEKAAREELGKVDKEDIARQS